MIIPFISKGYGILVPLVVVMPIIAIVGSLHLLIPDMDVANHMMVPGVSFMLSAGILQWATRLPTSKPSKEKTPPSAHDYGSFARGSSPLSKPHLDDTDSVSRKPRDLGWFMFIPTRIWPYLLGAFGLVLVVGEAVERMTSP